jgi:hypothetical protein
MKRAGMAVAEFQDRCSARPLDKILLGGVCAGCPRLPRAGPDGWPTRHRVRDSGVAWLDYPEGMTLQGAQFRFRLDHIGLSQDLR